MCDCVGVCVFVEVLVWLCLCVCVFVYVLEYVCVCGCVVLMGYLVCFVVGIVSILRVV